MPPFPQAATTAAAVLEYIRANSGCSQNAAALSLAVKPHRVARVLRLLAERGLIEIVVDDRGYKTLTAIGGDDA